MCRIREAVHHAAVMHASRFLARVLMHRSVIGLVMGLVDGSSTPIASSSAHMHALELVALPAEFEVLYQTSRCPCWWWGC